MTKVDDDKVFKALADASRRQLLDRLRLKNGLSLNELAAGHAMSRQAVTKHLAVLEEAGLVTSIRQGREKQWFWTYEYPGADAGFSYDSLGLSDADDAAKGEPRLLGVDNILEVPVNKVVEIETTGADVIHSWAIPQFGVKMDAVPGRLNHTWFKATQLGTFYGQCSELCGARHAFMPIEVKVVSDADYAAWLAASKKKFAALDEPTRVAAK